MKNNNPSVKSLYELYQIIGLKDTVLKHAEGFTIHRLLDMHLPLPYRSPSFRPEYFSLLFIKSGKGAYTIDNYTFNAESHSIYFTNPSNYRTFGWDKIEDIYLITFDENFLKQYVADNVYEIFPFLLTETISPKTATDTFYLSVEEIYLLMYKEYVGNNADRLPIIGHLLAALLYKIREYFWKDYNPIYEGNRSSQIVKTFKRNLEQHFRELMKGKTDTPLRVQDYADKQFLNVNYLSNVISSKTGKSISTWIADKMIAEAKVMLQNEAFSIKEIASKLGFHEAAHFSNYFRKHTDTSPAEYRKGLFSK